MEETLGKFIFNSKGNFFFSLKLTSNATDVAGPGGMWKTSVERA